MTEKMGGVGTFPMYKSTHNSAIFELHTPDFAWIFIWSVQPNDKVQKQMNTKVQNYESTKVKREKYKKYKNTKRCKTAKNVKT